MIGKILKISGIVILALIGLLFAAPFIFKGRIVQMVKSQVNKSINAKAEFEDVDVSFFRRFPRVSVAIDSVKITGVDEFANDTLLVVEKLNLAVNLMSLLRGDNIKVYSLDIERPVIHAIIAKNGKANWDITKDDTSATKNGDDNPFKLELQKYSIKNGFISYNDSVGNVSSKIINFNHTGSGDFTEDLFTLKTKTTADSVTIYIGAIPYLFNTSTRIAADIEVDNKLRKYSFKTDSVALNGLQLTTQGFVQQLNDSTQNIDIKFNAPSTDFKNILSLVPVVYKKDFNKIKTSGNGIFEGFIKGISGPKLIPSYHIKLDVKDGFFQYPDLPRPLDNINLTFVVDNPDGVPDHSVYNIPRGHLEIDNEPFDFRLLIKNPVTDMFVDAAAKGKLDLSKISQLIKLDAGTRLRGLLNANVAVNGTVTAIEKQQFDQFNASGVVDVNNFLYSSKEYPDGVRLNTISLSFNPRNVTVRDLSGNYLNTNFSANGIINNFLAALLKNKPLEGEFNVKADKLNLNEWMGTSTDTGSKAAAGSEPFVVPGNVRILVNSVVESVHYDKLDIQKLSGTIQVSDEKILLNDVKGNALGGSLAFSGSYSTAESKKKPEISFTYDVKDFDVQKTFYAFNTVQKLMPVGKYLAGKLNSQLTLNGQLGENMLPDYNSLTGNGNLLLIEGFLRKFRPLEKLGEILDIKHLQELAMREVRNHFEFSNGRVKVKPFDLRVLGIEMQIGGNHGFDQSLDYIINLKVPRSKMGGKGNNFVDNLGSQVSNKGLPIKVGEQVDFYIHLGGFISNPTIKINLKQTAKNLIEELKNQAMEAVKAKIDSAKSAVKTIVKDSLKSIKKDVGESAGEKLKRQIFGKKDSATVDSSKNTNKKAKESAKDVFDIFRKKKKPTDTTKTNQ